MLWYKYIEQFLGLLGGILNEIKRQNSLLDRIVQNLERRNKNELL